MINNPLSLLSLPSFMKSLLRSLELCSQIMQCVSKEKNTINKASVRAGARNAISNPGKYVISGLLEGLL
ncbi:hypothetical protein RH08_04015 [Candidatus Liberibacter asiaticus]|uniref:Uncharacterized protein n=2 Tax=Liberibacter asiaticus TaxID=34021 RepID=C6XG82_LIBAP|nr:hypothetical protein CLIBASIA_04055 [Candidatus Liberibacter asiaticus str. psy62]AGH17148.1 hypothetical protein WSI_03890 [Candidatus Liberibacter asiaticus str. gxpsy]ALK07455.1 hypothetical protein CD16_03970 [Candidatus Liberibacter asiaticus]BAP26675.1 hypothetical protein CGUJ_04055 [Candidatus Liberibacter asiaticus str. Ishi-1]ASK52947.1 hypothetical protein B2I23_04025 [Candidatus Liberibacter asiaticus]